MELGIGNSEPLDSQFEQQGNLESIILTNFGLDCSIGFQA
jgi:hypothetical protein